MWGGWEGELKNLILDTVSSRCLLSPAERRVVCRWTQAEDVDVQVKDDWMLLNARA